NPSRAMATTVDADGEELRTGHSVPAKPVSAGGHACPGGSSSGREGSETAEPAGPIARSSTADHLYLAAARYKPGEPSRGTRQTRLRGALSEQDWFESIIGQAPAFREALDQAARVAPEETTVLLTGESGTGKELVARAIHHASRRAEGPFI